MSEFPVPKVTYIIYQVGKATGSWVPAGFVYEEDEAKKLVKAIGKNKLKYKRMRLIKNIKHKESEKKHGKKRNRT